MMYTASGCVGAVASLTYMVSEAKSDKWYLNLLVEFLLILFSAILIPTIKRLVDKHISNKEVKDKINDTLDDLADNGKLDNSNKTTEDKVEDTTSPSNED